MEYSKNYHPFNKFILRTPLFPFSFVKQLTSGKSIDEKTIKTICAIPEVYEAVYIASPPLFYEMQKWLAGETATGKKALKKAERLKESLIRYFLRMSTRCTPFGLFAGFSTGTFADKSGINLLPHRKNISHTRLDMNYLCALALDLSRRENIKNKLKFYPNSTIYLIGEQLRYVEYHYVNSRRVHHLTAVDNSEYIQRIFKTASSGTFSKQLAQSITEEDISFEEALAFVDELIEAQLLVSELEPTVTGEEFLDRIITVLSAVPKDKEITEILSALKNINAKLKQLSKTDIGRPAAVFEEITNKLKSFETKFELKFLYQTDMVKPAESCVLSESITEDLYKGIEILNKLTKKYPEDNLSKFVQAFRQRYEEEEIPILQALDTEAGIGYLQNGSGDISPLVDDLMLTAKPNDFSEFKWNNVHALLHRKYIDCIERNEQILELTDAYFNTFQLQWNDLPETMAAMVQIMKEEKQNKPTVFIKSVGGSSAANLIGRFCHADRQSYELVHEIIEKDEAGNRNAVYAEIVHLPESRIGNILSRPALRKHEIPYLAKACVNDENRITVDDLYLSVRGDKILLRSKRLNKEVVPRLTTAHNYSFNALPVYQFLCDLQTQNLRGGLSFNWGPLEQQHRFLPRVVYKNLILSRATWNISKQDMELVYKEKENEKQIELFREFKEKYQIPHEIVLADSDNELYLNLDNKTCIQILLNQVKKRNGFTLKEFLFTEDNLMVQGEEGGFTNEFIIAFHKTKSTGISDETNEEKTINS